MAYNGYRPGIYNVEYFSGAQTSLYIGDVLVDEVTSISFAVQNSRSPIYGYASELYDDLSKGRVLVQGEFSINFKEAGYLWLILNRYHKLAGRGDKLVPLQSSDEITKMNIEAVVNGEISTFERNEIIKQIGAAVAQNDQEKFRHMTELNQGLTRRESSKTLRGFSADSRAFGGAFLGSAEEQFEIFEDFIWSGKSNEEARTNRRADDPELNPFEIYISFGDYVDDNSLNHTVQKITDVSIVGSSKRVVIDGQPIQEVYSFIGRDII